MNTQLNTEKIIFISICIVVFILILGILSFKAINYAYGETYNSVSNNNTSTQNKTVYENIDENAAPYTNEDEALIQNSTKTFISNSENDDLRVTESIYANVLRGTSKIIECNNIVITNNSSSQIKISKVSAIKNSSIKLFVGKWTLTDENGIILFDANVGKEYIPDNYIIPASSSATFLVSYSSDVVISKSIIGQKVMDFEFMWESVD